MNIATHYEVEWERGTGWWALSGQFKNITEATDEANRVFQSGTRFRLVKVTRETATNVQTAKRDTLKAR